MLIEPGQNFAAYDWGTTFDTIWPGIMTRPEVLREQTIQGSYPTTDLLQAFDLTLQQGTYEPSTLAPIARLFSAGDVVLQSNLAYWRYNTPRPQETWSLFDPPPAGIGKPVAFGKPVAIVAPARYSLVDEEALAVPAEAPWPPPIAVFPVSDARPIYRAEPAGCPLVIDGSGPGVVAAAAAGLLDDNPDDLLRRHPRRRRQAAARGAHARSPAGTDRLEPQGPRALVICERQHRRDPPGRDRALEAGPDLGGTAFVQKRPTRHRKRRRLHRGPLRGSLRVRQPGQPHARGQASRGLRRQPRHGLERRRLLGCRRQLAPGPPRPPRGNRSHNLVQVLGSTSTGGSPGRRLSSTVPTPSRRTEPCLPDRRRPDGPLPKRSFTTLRITIDGTTWSGRRSMLAASGVGFSEVRIPGVQHPRDDPDAIGPLAGARCLLPLAPAHDRHDP